MLAASARVRPIPHAARAAVPILDGMSDQPEFLVCVECESPTYVYEWRDGKVTEAMCEVCGNDDADTFLTQQDWEDLVEAPA